MREHSDQVPMWQGASIHTYHSDSVWELIDERRLLWRAIRYCVMHLFIQNSTDITPYCFAFLFYFCIIFTNNYIPTTFSDVFVRLLITWRCCVRYDVFQPYFSIVLVEIPEFVLITWHWVMCEILKLYLILHDCKWSYYIYYDNRTQSTGITNVLHHAFMMY